MSATTTRNDSDQLTAALIGARLDRLPAWPFPRAVLSMVGTGFFFLFFDIQTIGPALPNIVSTFHSSVTAGAITVSLSLWGYIVGSPLISYVSDRFGRRAGLLAAVLAYSISALGTALAPSMPVFMVLRFIGGMGIGAAIAIISTYVSELAPARRRGRSMAWAALPAQIGGGVTPFVAVWLVPGLAWGWRVFLAIPIVAALIFVLGHRLLPESPRWLAATGRLDEADRLTSEAERRVEARVGALPPVPALVAEPLARSQQPRNLRTRILLLLRPPYVRWTSLFLGIWILQTLIAYGMGGVGVTILVEHGLTLTKSIELTFGNGIGAMVGGVAAVLIGDRWPRKYVAAGVALVPATALLLLGFLATNGLVLASFALVHLQTGLASAVVYTLTAEHFPTGVRNTGVALSDGVGHLGGALGPLVALAVFTVAGFSAVWVVLAAGYLLYASLMLLARQTSGRSLDASPQAAPAAPHYGTEEAAT